MSRAAMPPFKVKLKGEIELRSKGIFSEVINASGWALPPIIIFKAKLYHYAWFDDLLGDW